MIGGQISNGTLTLDGGGALQLSGSATIPSSPLTLIGGATLDLSTLTSNIFVIDSLTAPTNTSALILGAKTLVLGGDNSSTTNRATITGTGGLVKNGFGTLTLGSSSSTFSGGVNLNNGSIALSASKAFGVGPVTISNGTAIGSITSERTVTNAITVNGDFTLGVGGESTTFSGNIDLGGSARTITLVNSASFGGNVTNGNVAIQTNANSVSGAKLTVLATANLTGTTTVLSGSLIVTNSTLNATIVSNSATVTFTSAPGAGTYPVLNGPLNTTSLASTSVLGLGAGFTGTLTNDPNLVVKVSGTTPAGPTFDTVYSPGSENTPGSNGLQNLMNYALGGTGPSSSPALPVLTSDGASLTLTANIRNNDQGVNVVGQWATSLEGPWYDVALSDTGATSVVPDTTVKAFSQAVESDKPRKFLRYKVTKQ